jgi:predicted porin
MRDTGIGGTLSYMANGWNGYVSGTTYNYDDADCSFDVNVPNSLRRLNRERFRSFASSLLSRAAARAGGRIGQNAALLQDSFGGGVAYQWNHAGLAADYTRTKDEFTDTTQDNYSLTGSFDLTASLSMNVTAGTTVADTGTLPYAGLYLKFAW